jgi:hypothetical protein
LALSTGATYETRAIDLMALYGNISNWFSVTDHSCIAVIAASVYAPSTARITDVPRQNLMILSLPWTWGKASFSTRLPGSTAGYGPIPLLRVSKESTS